MVVSLVSGVALFSGQQDVIFFDLEGIINSALSVLRLLIVSRVDININISTHKSVCSILQYLFFCLQCPQLA